MSSAALTKVKDQLSRMKNAAAKVREHGKEIVAEVGGTALGAVTSAGLGILDEAKGTIRKGNLTGIRYHSVGPVPTALIVGGVGKLGALALIGDTAGVLASHIGGAGIDIGSYLGARQLYASNKSKSA